MTSTTKLGLPLIDAAQAQKHVTHNEAINSLDQLVQASVISQALAAPPASPSPGDAYIVAAAATAEWTGKTGTIAAWQDGAWAFYQPLTGWLVWSIADARIFVWSGTAWVDAFGLLTQTLQNVQLLGLGTTATTANPLAAKLNTLLLTSKSVAESGTGDLRATLNKSATANTLSLLYQTAYSGRAEVGLCGDDSLHVKVSPDGSSWLEAMKIDAASGALTLLPGGLLGGGRLKSMSWFGASGTWTRPSGVRLALILAKGAGGGGGGAAGAASSGAAGAGGGAGALAIKLLDVSAVTSRTVTVGTGGAGGATTGGTGTTGGTTSFGSDAVAAGGVGGAGMTAGTTVSTTLGGTGGSASAGDYLFDGAPGAPGLRFDGTNVNSGNGGPGFFGGGARGASGNTTGAASASRGSGGGGASVSSSSTGRAGGNGADGLVWVWEFE